MNVENEAITIEPANVVNGNKPQLEKKNTHVPKTVQATEFHKAQNIYHTLPI